MKQVTNHFKEAEDWSDEVPFEEIRDFNRLQNKIAELETNKTRHKFEPIKSLHKTRRGK
jgi:hypothetical protein